jgi:hypothetical protein
MQVGGFVCEPVSVDFTTRVCDAIFVLGFTPPPSVRLVPSDYIGFEAPLGVRIVDFSPAPGFACVVSGQNVDCSPTQPMDLARDQVMPAFRAIVNIFGEPRLEGRETGFDLNFCGFIAAFPPLFSRCSAPGGTVRPR